MSILVVYATKSGASEQCARLLSEQLPHCTICDIGSEKPTIDEFDSIIVGAGVRDGKIYKPLRDFIKKNHSELLNKKMGYFICNEKPRKTEEILDENIPNDLKKAAVCMESFGGYKAYAAPKENEDPLKRIFVDKIRTFAEKFMI
ncbi:flavodoxin domain-containing protein [Paenibacillus sp. Cedars]|uniref:flavodoxin domain-containing protein n=1 Tax=Paenibacillus sp. Cedars TaxID=1980674 RepID=UPI0011657ACA|nr:flavodoxin domain-containing protein [Paenibacillus sp. Cedars]AWP26398.1 flavodoxin [Paenibacillus sp. Cedars]